MPLAVEALLELVFETGSPAAGRARIAPIVGRLILAGATPSPTVFAVTARPLASIPIASPAVAAVPVAAVPVAAVPVAAVPVAAIISTTRAAAIVAAASV